MFVQERDNMGQIVKNIRKRKTAEVYGEKKLKDLT